MKSWRREFFFFWRLPRLACYWRWLYTADNVAHALAACEATILAGVLAFLEDELVKRAWSLFFYFDICTLLTVLSHIYGILYGLHVGTSVRMDRRRWCVFIMLDGPYDTTA